LCTVSHILENNQYVYMSFNKRTFRPQEANKGEQEDDAQVLTHLFYRV